MVKFTSKSLEEMQKIADGFVSAILPKISQGEPLVNLGKATVVGLYGDLGAGKTTFTQFVAKALGLGETVTSPTFVIEKIYPIRTNGRKRPTSNGASRFSHLIHIDAYRIESGEELLHLGWKEIISDPNNLIIIEWADRVTDIMPLWHIKVKFSHVSPDSREIEIIS